MTPGHAPFADLHPESGDLLDGAYATLRPRSGLLREEPGATYAVRATAYSHPPGGAHRDAAGFVTREPTRRLYALAGGVVRGAEGAVIDPASGLAVRETVETWDEPLARHAALRPDGFEPVVRLPGVSMLLATLGGEGFFHFLIDALPKLALVREVSRSVDHVLVAGRGEPWRTAWLVQAGVDPARVRWLSAASHLACDQLLFTNRLVHHFEPNPWAVAALRSLVPSPEPRAGDDRAVLWLDRTHAPARRKPWEGALHAVAAPDATAVDFAGAAPLDVASACARAGAFAGLHGAAFANILFAPAGARVLEFQAEPVAPWYARLAAVCGHRHLAVPVSADTLALAAASARSFLEDDQEGAPEGEPPPPRQ